MPCSTPSTPGSFAISGPNSTPHISVIGADAKLCIAGNATTSTCGERGETADPRTGGGYPADQQQHSPRRSGSDRSNILRGRLRSTGPPQLDGVLTPATKLSFAKDYAAAAEANDPLLDEWLGPASNHKYHRYRTHRSERQSLSERRRAVHATARLAHRPRLNSAHAGAGCGALLTRPVAGSRMDCNGFCKLSVSSAARDARLPCSFLTNIWRLW